MAEKEALLLKELDTLGLTSWDTKNALSYFRHSSGNVSLASVQLFYDRAIRLAERAAAHIRSRASISGAAAAQVLREETAQHGHCSGCHALYPQHHSGCSVAAAQAQEKARRDYQQEQLRLAALALRNAGWQGYAEQVERAAKDLTGDKR